MTAATDKPKTSLEVGQELRAAPRMMNRERMRWYVDGLFTARRNDGTLQVGDINIHTDDAFALAQGLPGIIADGMISTNWIYSLLLDTFGASALRDGSLRTKYIKPILEDQVVTACLRVREVARADGGLRYGLDVWCEDAQGAMLTVGAASVLVLR